jgi:hypothetical protein
MVLQTYGHNKMDVCKGYNGAVTSHVRNKTHATE